MSILSRALFAVLMILIFFILGLTIAYFILLPEGVSGRPSITQSNLETQSTLEGTEGTIRTLKLSEGSQEACVTLDEIKEILRIKASQKRRK